MTALSQIFAAIDARLSGLVPSYERMPSGDPDEYPAIRVYDDGDEPIPGEVGATHLTCIINVEGLVEGSGGAATHDAMTQLHAECVSALCGDGGDLGGLVETIEILGRRRVAVAELSEVRHLAFAQDFAVTFATPTGDPSTFA